MVKPKKHLGQHFLVQDGVAASIAQSIQSSKKNTPVLEIGPGTGVLTQEILALQFKDFKVVEIDKESIAYLNQNFPQLSGHVIDGDFLKMDLETLFGGSPFVLAGNFPYNISSQILFRIFENKDLIPEMVGMFQKEVAERAIAGPGSKIYGILSVLLGIYYEGEYLFTIDEQAFNPPPKVKSGVIRLTRNERTELPVTDKFFKTVVKLAFNQRRKTLKNSLSSLIAGKDITGLEGIMKLRPEQLSPEGFLELAVAIYQLEQ